MAELQNIDLSVFRKKQFTIDGDENRILELDTSDLNIIKRIKESKSEEKIELLFAYILPYFLFFQ